MKNVEKSKVFSLKNPYNYMGKTVEKKSQFYFRKSLPATLKKIRKNILP